MDLMLWFQAFKQDFVNFLFAFIRDYKLGAVLLLAGVDLSNRSDAQMRCVLFQALTIVIYSSQSSSTYKFIPMPGPQLDSTPLANISNLPTYSFAPAQHICGEEEPSKMDIPFIPGGGLTRRLLSSLSSSESPIAKIPTACVLQFVLEGDNRGDAIYFARAVVELLSVERHVVAWKQPSSWAAGLFGTTYDQSLYG